MIYNNVFKNSSFMKAINDFLNKIGVDKALHFLIGALLTAWVSPIRWGAVGVVFFVVLFISVLKELMIDEEKDWIDVAAGVAGSALSAGVYGIISLCS